MAQSYSISINSPFSQPIHKYEHSSKSMRLLGSAETGRLFLMRSFSWRGCQQGEGMDSFNLTNLSPVCRNSCFFTCIHVQGLITAIDTASMDAHASKESSNYHQCNCPTHPTDVSTRKKHQFNIHHIFQVLRIKQITSFSCSLRKKNPLEPRFQGFSCSKLQSFPLFFSETVHFP